ncbi:hypothetical protein [Methyloprofundus sp.]|uniref:hypothetical protein n=1 Tax=Methyloprofundus sp. TaxID=2020875 RepID=UPI003D137943
MSEIKQFIADGSLLAMDNPLFVGALVLVVWFLAAVLYNLKMLGIKKQLKTAEQGHLEVKEKLSAAEKLAKQQEDKLTSDTEQMLKDKQFMTDTEDKISARNQAVVANIRAIATRFDLSEQLVDSEKTMKDEFIWQQQDNIIQQLGDRLNAAQQEIAQTGEKDSLITNLQNSLDMQTKQFAQLEQAIEVQKQEQQEHQKEVQQQLSNTLEKHQLDFTQLIETVQNKLPAIDNSQQDKQASEQTSQSQVSQSQVTKQEHIAEQQIVEFSAIEPVNDINAENETTAIPEILESVAKLENILEQREQNEDQDGTSSTELPLDPEIDVDSEPNNLVQDLLNIAEPTFSTAIENEPRDTGNKVSEETKSSSNIASKFKNLLGKVKKSDATNKTESSPQTLTADELIVSNEIKSESTKVSGKFKSLLSKAKKTNTKTEPEQQVDSFTVEDTNVPEVEQQIETFTSEHFKEPEVEEVPVETDYGTSNFKMPGALKKMFGKAKK